MRWEERNREEKKERKRERKRVGKRRIVAHSWFVSKKIVSVKS